MKKPDFTVTPSGQVISRTEAENRAARSKIVRFLVMMGCVALFLGGAIAYHVTATRHLQVRRCYWWNTTGRLTPQQRAYQAAQATRDGAGPINPVMSNQILTFCDHAVGDGATYSPIPAAGAPAPQPQTGPPM